MLLAVCSDKGSPGSTTVALALASVWREQALLVEADPYGGDLAIRLRSRTGTALAPTPTVLTLATAARTNPTMNVLDRCVHEAGHNLAVVPGHLVAEQLSGVADWQPLASVLSACPTPVIVDLGRLHAASPVSPIAAMADLVLVVGRPEAGSVIHLRERLTRLASSLGALRNGPTRLFPVLTTSLRHGTGDLADLRQLLADTGAAPFIADHGFLALDPSALRRLERGENPGGRLARTPLMRTARDLVGQLEPLLGAGTSRATGETTAGVR